MKIVWNGATWRFWIGFRTTCSMVSCGVGGEREIIAIYLLLLILGFRQRKIFATFRHRLVLMVFCHFETTIDCDAFFSVIDVQQSLLLSSHKIRDDFAV